MIGKYSLGARELVAAGPRVLKVLDLHGEMLEAIRDYKRQFPRGTVVVRIYTTGSYVRDSDPSAAGEDYWDHKLAPALAQLSPADRRLIDLLEGPNECEAYPAWDSPQTARWFADFWLALGKRMVKAGFRPCVGSIPVGNPPGSPEEIEAKLVAFAPALRMAARHGGAWSYHAYSLSYGTNVEEEIWYSLRYRMLHRMVVRHFPDLAMLPVVLTEAGIDRTGNPDLDGWRARGSAGKFKHWLKWFDARLCEDDYVLGATLFQSGCPWGWASFEVEPVLPWLARYLMRPPAQLEPQ